MANITSIIAEALLHSRNIHGDDRIRPDCEECMRLAKAVLDCCGVKASDQLNDLPREYTRLRPVLEKLASAETSDREVSLWDEI